MKYAKSVLVFDDEEVVRQVLSMTIKSLGYQVICASTREEALDLYRKKNDEIGLVLADNTVIINNRKISDEGIKLTKEIRALERELISPRLHLPIISISGEYKSDEFYRKALDAGIDDFYPKPFKLEEIKTLVKTKLAA